MLTQTVGLIHHRQNLSIISTRKLQRGVVINTPGPIRTAIHLQDGSLDSVRPAVLESAMIISSDKKISEDWLST